MNTTKKPFDAIRNRIFVLLIIMSFGLAGFGQGNSGGIEEPCGQILDNFPITVDHASIIDNAFLIQLAQFDWPEYLDPTCERYCYLAIYFKSGPDGPIPGNGIQYIATSGMGTLQQTSVVGYDPTVGLLIIEADHTPDLAGAELQIAFVNGIEPGTIVEKVDGLCISDNIDRPSEATHRMRRSFLLQNRLGFDIPIGHQNGK